MTDPWILVFGVLTCAVVVLSVLYVGLLRRVSSVLEDAEQAIGRSPAYPPDMGLRTGEKIDSAVTTDGSGRQVELTELIAERSAIVLLAAADCDPCHRLLEDVSSQGWAHESVQLIVVLDEPTHLDSVLAAANVAVLYQGAHQSVSRAVRSNIFPHAFAVSRNIVVASPVIPASMEELVRLGKDEHLGQPPSTEPAASSLTSFEH